MFRIYLTVLVIKNRIDYYYLKKKELLSATFASFCTLYIIHGTLPFPFACHTLCRGMCKGFFLLYKKRLASTVCRE